MSSPFSRSLPPGADLEQQKKQAKELLRAYHAGTANAVSRVRAVLPGKPRLALADAQFVLSRECGFESWASLKQHLDAQARSTRSPEEQLHDAFQRRDAAAARRLLTKHPGFRAMINAPVFAFNSPAIVTMANDAAMVDVLLEFGADPSNILQADVGGSCRPR